ncbi:MAG TPA: NEW3 domain-containing protein [Thermoanaerobaculia bacterium]|jgi:hypothetical protein
MFRLHRLAILLLLVLAAASAFANVTVTPAAGGLNVSADRAANATSPAYTNIGPITIAEGADTDFAVGTNVTLGLNPPSGWTFNPGVGGVAAANGRNISSQSINVTASVVTVTMTIGGTNKTDTLTISNLQVRPIDGLMTNNTPGLGSGNIRIGSTTANIAGLSGTTNFGTLSMTFGAAHHLAIQQQPSATATAGVAFATQPAVRVLDQFGNLRANDSVTSVSAAASGGTATLQGTLSATASLGVATFSNLSYNKAETITLAFTSGALTGTSSNSIAVSAAAASKLLFTTSPGASTAGALLAPQPVVKTADAFDNLSTSGLAPSVPITFSIASGSGTLLGTTVRDIGTGAGNGTVTATDLQINNAGTFTLGVSGAGSAASSSFTVSPGAANRLAMVIQPPSSATAGAAFSPAPQVRIEDAYGNVRGSDTTTITATRNSGSGTTALAGTTSVAAAAGVATFSNLRYNTAGESIAVDFSASGLTGVTSSSVTINPGAATTLTVTPSTTNATAGAGLTVTVTARDSVGNVATGYTGTVHFTSTDGAAVLPANYTFTGGDAGVHVFSVTLKTSGSRTVTATDTVTATIAGTTAAITVSPDAAATLTVSAPASSTAGNAVSVTVTAKDAFNNIATGYSGTVHFTSADASAVLPSDYTFVAGDNGAHLFSATLKTAGAQSITAADTVSPAIAGSASVTVNPATVNTLTISAPPAATAGSAFSVTVTAKDAFGNTATGYTGTVSFSSSDSNRVLPSNYTFVAADNGTRGFNVTLRTAGTQTVGVGDGTRNATSGNIAVSAATVNTLTISAPGTATAGSAIGVTVTAKDAFNNIATSYTGTVAFTSTDGAAVLPSNYTFVAGDGGTHLFSATLKTAGTRTITANDGTRNATTGSIAVGAAAASQLTVVPAASSLAGVAFSGTVTAKDPFGNIATAYNGTIHFTTSDTNAPLLPANYTFVAGDNGAHTFTSAFTLKSAGAQSVTATDTVTASIAGSGSVTIDANDATALGFSTQPGNATAGAAFGSQPVLKTFDAYGNASTRNLAHHQTVTVAIATGSGTLQGTAAGDVGLNGATPGTLAFTGLRIDTAGAKTLGATSSGLTGATSNSFTVAPAAASVLVFTQQPGNATAGAPFGTQPVVRSRDAYGNDSTAGLGASKVVTMVRQSGSGTLLGTTAVDIAGSGIATYSDLEIDAAGAKTLSASATGLGSVTSSSFTVSAGAPATMTKTAGDGQSATAGATVAVDPSVTLVDAFGNPVSGVSVTFTPAAGSGSVTGGTQSTSSSGVATVTSWTLGAVAGTNTLTASAASLTQDFTATGVCTYTTKASGNWNASSTWVGECVPAAGDDVTISSGHTVTVTADAAASSLTFATATADTTVALSDGVTLTVAGLLKINAPSTSGVDSTMSVGNGTLSLGGLELNGAGNRSAILSIVAGTVNVAGNATFPGNPPTQLIRITGAGSFNIQGNFDSGANLDGTLSANSTFRFNGSSQTVGSYNPNNYFPNVIVDSSVTLLGNFPVANTLTINSGKTLTTSGTLHLLGDFVDNGTFTSTGTVIASGSAAQTFSGSADPIAFTNLTINNAAGLTLATNATIAGTLTLTSGNVDAGANTLTLLGSGSVSRTSGHVLGNFAKVFTAIGAKTFEVGTANGYSPVTVTAAAGSFPATFTARAVQAQHPASPTANALQRYWVLANGGISSADLTFNYLAGDVAGNELAYALGNYNNGWSYPPAAVSTLTHAAVAGGVTQFGDFTLHAKAVALQVVSVNGGTNPNADSAFDVVVRAVDSVGDPAGVPANTSIGLTLANGTGALGGTLTGMIPTGSSSVTISGVTYRIAESGVVLTAAATAGATLLSANSAPFTVDPGATTHFDVTAPASSVAGSAFDLTVDARDAWNNLTPAFAGTVTLTSSDTNATLPADATLTAGTRTYTAATTLRTAGAQSVTATSSTITGTASVNVSPAATDHLVISAPSTTIAGDAFGATVTAYDAYDNVTPAYNGTVTLTSTDGNATLPSSHPYVSADGGIYTFGGIVLTTAGAQTLTASDGTRNDGASITVNAAALDRFAIGNLATQTAGVAFNAAITAQDAYGNTVPTFAGTTTITSSGTLTSAPVTSGAFVNGVLAAQPLTITSAQSGTTVSVSDGTHNGTSNAFTVNAAAVDHFAVGNVAAQTAGVPFNLAATAQDAFNNTATSFTGTVSVTSNGTLIAAPVTSATFVSGVLAAQPLTITSAQATTVVSITDGAHNGASNAFTVNAAAVDHFAVGNVAAQTAGVPFNLGLTAQDAFNNTAASFNGSVTITSNGTLTGAPVTSASFVNGVLAAQPLTITSAQPNTTLQVASGAHVGASNAFTVNAAALHHFDVEGFGGGAVGGQMVSEPFAIRITARDAFNNLASAFTGTAAITSNGPLSSGAGATSAFTAGVLANHTVAFGSPSLPGTFTITATRSGGSESGTSNAFTVGGFPDLEVSIAGPASTGAGHVETFVITVTNSGPAQAANVSLNFTAPAGWMAVPQTTCASIPCALGTLAANQTRTIEMRVTADTEAASGAYTLSASVTSTTTESDDTNNAASITATIGACPSVSQMAPSGSGGVSGELTWSAEGATEFDVYLGAAGSGCSTFLGFTSETRIAYSGLEPGKQYEWRVVAHRDGCPLVQSSCVKFTTTCEKPNISAVVETMSKATYHIRWSEAGGATSYVIQEAASADFAGATSTTVSGTSAAFRHEVSVPTAFFYRVRAVGACTNDFSRIARVVVQPPGAPTDGEFDLVVERGAADLIEQPALVRTPQGLATTRSAGFTATSNVPWLTVTPSSGTIAPDGTTLRFTVRPGELPAGVSTATVTVRSADGTTLAAYPVSLYAMESMDEGGKSASGAASSVVPAVAHAGGINSLWRSDLRIYNPSDSEAAYDLFFTPSRTDGRTEGRHSRMSVAAHGTMALGDVVRRIFGYGVLGESATGALEVRPAGSAPIAIISSRTYNATSNGTYGQFIGAVPTSQFATAGNAVSLQQVAQSDAYRTNVGLVEGSGAGANVVVRIFDDQGAQLAEEAVSLEPFEHRQLDALLTQHAVRADDARVEVEVTSPQGSVAAYASVVDNYSNDPLLVPGVVPASIAATRYVVPGVAHLTTPTNTWRSDVRIYNAGNASAAATLTYYPQGGGSAIVRSATLAPHVVQTYDNILETLFGATNSGGALHVTTSTASSLVVSARTYDRRPDGGGTYGQFIPAVTIDDAARLGGRAIELLHVDQSVRFRTNVGLAEVGGHDARVEITATADGRTESTTIDLAANEFRQIGSLLTSLGFADVTNARVSVRVVGGSGAVIAYASNIDNRTQDPTYIPAQ